MAAPFADIDTFELRKYLFSIKKISLFLSIIPEKILLSAFDCRKEVFGSKLIFDCVEPVVPDELNIEIFWLLFLEIKLKFLNNEAWRKGRSEIFFTLGIDLKILSEINL